MKIIYVMINKKNGKKYVGQTNNFKLRMNGHKSNAFNPKSHSYKSPLSCAIRKYGWENFSNKVVEEISDEEDWKYVDEREKFFISYYKSLTSQNGYNILVGGSGSPREKLSFEERVSLSKLFTLPQVVDIQNRMIAGEKRCTIIADYPHLSNSMFNNINAGLNFQNEKLAYPLHNYKNDMSARFTKEEIDQIKSDIIEGVNYKSVAAKWDISMGMISLINNGKQWYEEKYSYPLRVCNTSRTYNANTWVKDVQQDLLYSSLNMQEIAQKYQKAYSTIKKINSGSSHKNKNYKYPLTSNRT